MNYDDLIDTRPGQYRLFSPPLGIEDYSIWLQAQYLKQHYKDGENICLLGVAQKIHELIQRPQIHTSKMVAIGPYAGSAAEFIEKLASDRYGKQLVIEVIPW